MPFFKKSAEAAPSEPKPRKDRLRFYSGLGAGLLITGAFVVPVDFVTEQPGPTFNTIGEYKGKQLISIEGEKTYPVTGDLDMTTVSVAGGPNTDIMGLHVLSAWFSPSDTVFPTDAMYAPTTTHEQVSSQNSADMVSSQELAQAAALDYLGKDFTVTLTITGSAEDGASAGKLKEGDVLESIGGKKITRFEQIAEILNDTKDKPIDITVKRDGKSVTEKITPQFDQEHQRYLLGLYLGQKYEFPMTVNYGLENVGGPSAGMMFALGIIDELTDQDMTGGKHFAGTGTIAADGTVGPIGGIAQKMKGAQDAGATVFLAPADNCDEVVGHVPDGLSVVKVSTLKEAADAVKAIGEGKDPSTFATCTAG